MLNRFAHQWIQMDLATGKLRLYCVTHPFVPKLYQMILNCRNCFIRFLGRKKAADLVRHVG